MAQSLAPRRYALAVFELAKESGRFDEWLADLDALAGMCADDRVQAFLADPKVGQDQKARTLVAVGGRVSEQALNLTRMLVQHGRASILPLIRTEFARLVNDYRGVAEAEVTTAVPLSEPQAEQVAARLEQITGRKIVMRRRVDASILGGIVARVGDKVVDGSLVARLASLRQQIQ